MKKVLLYSPDLIGHPRVYCRAIADAMAGAPRGLVIALGISKEATLDDSPDLQPLASRNRVQLVDTRDHSQTGQPHLSAEELRGLQDHYDIDTTLFIEADKWGRVVPRRRLVHGRTEKPAGTNDPHHSGEPQTSSF